MICLRRGWLLRGGWDCPAIGAAIGLGRDIGATRAGGGGRG